MITPIIHPHLVTPLKKICLLFKTPKPTDLIKFYNHLNNIASKVNKTTSHDPRNQRICVIIIPFNTPHTGFTFIRGDTEKEEEIYDPDGRPIYFCSENSRIFDRSILFSSKFIPILRSSSLEATKDFYSHYGTWQEEQHGNGPKHYSAAWNEGPLTEIYPVKKNFMGNTELFFQINDFSQFTENLKANHFKTLSSEHSQISILDPDNRLIKILPSQIQ